MSRNGSGTYTLTAGNPVVTGTTISSTWANNTLTDIATALTGSLAADGQTTATGNLKMGNNRITGLADGTLSTDAATVSQLTAASATYLLKASNLSDVADVTTARGNLTAAKSGANSDITSLTGLTTPLTVAQGGTGAATHTTKAVLIGNGTSAVTTVSPGTLGNVLTSDGTNWTSATGAYPLTSGTAVASTSGTSVDFTSIPSWVKRVTIIFNQVSVSGTSSTLIQLGTGSTTYTTTGYVGGGAILSGAGVGGATFTNGFCFNNATAAASLSGNITITNVTGNTWVASGNCGATSTIFMCLTGGTIALGAALTAVRITTVNGTDTFDNGSLNILYE